MIPLLLSLAFTLTPSAAAETVLLYEFDRESIDENWQANRVETSFTEEGLYLTTDQGGTLTRLHTTLQPVEALTLSYKSAAKITIELVGEMRQSDGSKNIFELPLDLQQSGEFVTASIDLTFFDDWNPSGVLRIGFGFPPGSEVILESMTLHSWTLGEKLLSQWTSFWTPDDISGHSVNFLWGPLIVDNPIGIATMHDTLPPKADFGMWIMYAILGIGTIATLLAWKHMKRSAIKIVCIVFIGCWILLDLRMSMELFRGTLGDVRMIMSDDSYPEFRGHGNFHGFAAAAAELVADRTAFVFPVEESYPAVPLMLYYSYPSVPYTDIEVEGLDTWVVYSQSSTTFTGKNLIHNGEIIGEGEVLLRLNPNTFVFRLTK